MISQISDTNIMHPVTKLFIIIIYTISVFISNTVLTLCLCFSVFIFTVILSKTPIIRVFKTPVIIFTIFSFLTVYFTSSLKEAVFIAVRLFCASGFSVSALRTIKAFELANGIEAVFGESAKGLALMFSIIFSFINSISKQALRIKDAQLARGAKFNGNFFQKMKAYLTLIVPLFHSSLRQADELSQTIQSRCYSQKRKRTFLFYYGFTAVDTLTFIFFGLYFLIVVILRIF